MIFQTFFEFPIRFSEQLPVLELILPHFTNNETLVWRSIKSNLTVTAGAEGGDKEGKGGRVFSNNYKGHMGKTQAGWKQGREVGTAGRKCRQL